MADVDLDAGGRNLLPRPVGHGDHAGADGFCTADLTTDFTADLADFDMAAALVGPVLVEVEGDAATPIVGNHSPDGLAAAH